MVKARLLGAVGIAAVVSGIAGVLAAQAPVSPAFEVASVKPNKSGSMDQSILPRGGQFVATNESLRNLITTAYRVQWSRVVGGPDWLSDRFDVVAKMPDHAAPDQLGFMLQALLTDRFKLKTHRETREETIYALVVAKSDGRLGAQLRRSDVDCVKEVLANGGTPPVPPNPGEWPRCGSFMSGNGFRAGGLSMAALANHLTGVVNRVVIDRTGLTGNYDVDLQYTPDVRLPPTTSDLPSIFTAVQEQLGLKLESTTGPVDVLVIDHVEHPTED
jgi:uncharacterized protein (TIGR03435 family)